MDQEDALTLNIDHVMANSNKRFADKSETKKALRMLERQIKSLYDILTRDMVKLILNNIRELDLVMKQMMQ